MQDFEVETESLLLFIVRATEMEQKGWAQFLQTLKVWWA